MSACLITDEADQLQAAAHLIGTNQLPLPDNVSSWVVPEILDLWPSQLGLMMTI